MVWKPIETAPHDRPVRIKCDDGTTKRPVTFRLPYWWCVPSGEIRIADAALYTGEDDIMKATHWQGA